MEKTESQQEIATLKRRLKKALILAEKLKNENLIESEVNKELAKRNEVLKKDLEKQKALSEQLGSAQSATSTMERHMKQLFQLTDIIMSEADQTNPQFRAHEKSLMATKRRCFEASHSLKQTLFAMSGGASAEDGEVEEEDGEAGAAQLSQISTPPPATAAHERAKPAAAAAAAAAGEGEGEREEEPENEADANRDAQRPRSRIGSAVNNSITNHPSSAGGTRQRRNSSMFLRLPEMMGTSLLRKSVDDMVVNQPPPAPTSSQQQQQQQQQLRNKTFDLHDIAATPGGDMEGIVGQDVNIASSSSSSSSSVFTASGGSTSMDAYSKIQATSGINAADSHSNSSGLSQYGSSSSVGITINTSVIVAGGGLVPESSAVTPLHRSAATASVTSPATATAIATAGAVTGELTPASARKSASISSPTTTGSTSTGDAMGAQGSSTSTSTSTNPPLPPTLDAPAAHLKANSQSQSQEGPLDDNIGTLLSASAAIDDDDGRTTTTTTTTTGEPGNHTNQVQLTAAAAAVSEGKKNVNNEEEDEEEEEEEMAAEAAEAFQFPVPLFEHFIVVGAAEEAAREFAQHIHLHAATEYAKHYDKTVGASRRAAAARMAAAGGGGYGSGGGAGAGGDSSTLSTRMKRAFGGILAGNRFLAGGGSSGTTTSGGGGGGGGGVVEGGGDRPAARRHSLGTPTPTTSTTTTSTTSLDPLPAATPTPTPGQSNKSDGDNLVLDDDAGSDDASSLGEELTSRHTIGSLPSSTTSPAAAATPTRSMFSYFMRSSVTASTATSDNTSRNNLANSGVAAIAEGEEDEEKEEEKEAGKTGEKAEHKGIEHEDMEASTQRKLDSSEDDIPIALDIDYVSSTSTAAGDEDEKQASIGMAKAEHSKQDVEFEKFVESVPSIDSTSTAGSAPTTPVRDNQNNTGRNGNDSNKGSAPGTPGTTGSGVSSLASLSRFGTSMLSFSSKQQQQQQQQDDSSAAAVTLAALGNDATATAATAESTNSSSSKKNLFVDTLSPEASSHPSAASASGGIDGTNDSTVGTGGGIEGPDSRGSNKSSVSTASSVSSFFGGFASGQNTLAKNSANSNSLLSNNNNNSNGNMFAGSPLIHGSSSGSNHSSSFLNLSPKVASATVAAAASSLASSAASVAASASASSSSKEISSSASDQQQQQQQQESTITTAGAPSPAAPSPATAAAAVLVPEAVAPVIPAIQIPTFPPTAASAAGCLTQEDVVYGTATTASQILYRYPETAAPPPQEVSDFCLPLGGYLHQLSISTSSSSTGSSSSSSSGGGGVAATAEAPPPLPPTVSKVSDDESVSKVQEILFGHSHSKRSSRCFIFLLEDKTLADEVGDEETGVGTNRLYGVCVIHPRLLKTKVPAFNAHQAATEADLRATAETQVRQQYAQQKLKQQQEELHKQQQQQQQQQQKQHSQDDGSEGAAGLNSESDVTSEAIASESSSASVVTAVACGVDSSNQTIAEKDTPSDPSSTVAEDTATVAASPVVDGPATEASSTMASSLPAASPASPTSPTSPGIGEDDDAADMDAAAAAMVANATPSIEFESMVCYAFLTRFPLFDFFFQVIFDIINIERLDRMELAALSTVEDNDFAYSRSVYRYLPRLALDVSLSRLTRLKPPLHGEEYTFELSPGIKPITSIRKVPPLDFSEHYMNAAEWALPTLLSWMPIETIIWAVSLLLGEAKLVVIGDEYGMVSCAVIGLLVLLRPLDWVSPVIPMLPMGLMDFIESPVPILVGLMVPSDSPYTNPTPSQSLMKKGASRKAAQPSNANTPPPITAESIFQQCSDPSEDDIPLAVLDVRQRELFVSAHSSTFRTQLASMCIPQAADLAQRIKECLNDRSRDSYGTTGYNPNAPANNRLSKIRSKPLFTVSAKLKHITATAHDIFTTHLDRKVADGAFAHVQAQEEALRLKELQQQEEERAAARRREEVLRRASSLEVRQQKQQKKKMMKKTKRKNSSRSRSEDEEDEAGVYTGEPEEEEEDDDEGEEEEEDNYDDADEEEEDEEEEEEEGEGKEADSGTRALFNFYSTVVEGGTPTSSSTTGAGAGSSSVKKASSKVSDSGGSVDGSVISDSAETTTATATTSVTGVTNSGNAVVSAASNALASGSKIIRNSFGHAISVESVPNMQLSVPWHKQDSMLFSTSDRGSDRGSDAGGMSSATAAMQMVSNLTTDPSGNMILMSQCPLELHDREAFFKRFVLTQIYAEHVHRTSNNDTDSENSCDVANDNGDGEDDDIGNTSSQATGLEAGKGSLSEQNGMTPSAIDSGGVASAPVAVVRGSVTSDADKDNDCNSDAMTTNLSSSGKPNRRRKSIVPFSGLGDTGGMEEEEEEEEEQNDRNELPVNPTSSEDQDSATACAEKSQSTSSASGASGGGGRSMHTSTAASTTTTSTSTDTKQRIDMRRMSTDIEHILHHTAAVAAASARNQNSSKHTGASSTPQLQGVSEPSTIDGSDNIHNDNNDGILDADSNCDGNDRVIDTERVTGGVNAGGVNKTFSDTVESNELEVDQEQKRQKQEKETQDETMPLEQNEG